MGGSAAWENITIDITNNSDLSGTIYLSFGINCSGTGDVGGSGVTTIWYADDIELVAPAGGKVSDWGITDRGDGWPILNTEETPAGNGSIGSDEPLTAWATLRGSFGEALEATTEQAFVVQGQLEYAGAGTNDSYVGLRYALTLQADTLKNPDEGTLENQYSDSAKWVGGGVHYGYEFTPQSGTTVMANGAGGAGTTWIVNGGSGWNSTWSNNGYPIAAVEPAPRRASIEEGVYDWAISVQPLGDGTNEIRWYMMHEDETYWFGGTTIDTAQVATKFNGVAFGIGDDLPPELTEFKLMDVTYRLGDPIKVPEAPFSSFYVADWGAAGYEGWPILNDSTTLDGNAGMGADGPPDGWASLRGSFGTDVKATTEEAIIVEGKIEWVGGDCGDSYIPIRYALTFQADSLMNPAEGTLENQYTDSARWVDGGNHFGYSFMPVTGAGTMSNGGGGAGTNWIINNGNWVSTWSNNGYPIAAVKPAPRLAEITEGVYEFAISVQPLGNGTNEIRWYLVDENMESYWYAGSAIDTAQVTTQFNGVEFGLTGEHLDEITGLNVMDVKVDKGEPITVPPRIFQSFYVADWGLTNRGDGWPMLNDSTTLDGNAGMGSNEPLTAWTTMRENSVRLLKQQQKKR
ncbi:MAG: hypothetical protein U5R06_13755 [candidate division KSB1 bacterium]|nr:hypothetical protein [candidate division KSB1 bacterium]